jgi:hypothetical protein
VAGTPPAYTAAPGRPGGGAHAGRLAAAPARARLDDVERAATAPDAGRPPAVASGRSRGASGGGGGPFPPGAVEPGGNGRTPGHAKRCPESPTLLRWPRHRDGREDARRRRELIGPEGRAARAPGPPRTGG